MSNLAQPGALSPIARARLSAELLQIRTGLIGNALSPIEKVRASARGLAIRAQLGQPVPLQAGDGAENKTASPIRRVGPHTGDADNVPAQQQVSDDAVAGTVSDARSNITPSATTGHQLITGLVPQKSGGVLVMGDVDALDAYAHAYLDQAKYTKTSTGLVLSKSQTRLAQYLPSAQEVLLSGAIIYSYAEGGVSVAADGELSGIARNLPELKSLMAQRWGAEKYRAVFGEDAAPEDVQAYEDEQAAIAQRKQDSIDTAAQALATQQQSQEQEAERKQAEAEETARIVAERQAQEQAEFDRTIGAGVSENPIYQAYLDTLEELPTKNSNAGFLGWAGIRAGEFERLKGGRISANKDEYVAYVRQWADDHLAERVKGTSAAPAPAPQHEIIEYTTKRDKVLRGIIRTDLTLAEAKAIDPYTWRMNGGYFIREKHLAGDTSAIQAAPAPVVLSPEQEAEKQERDTRAALERQQQAISNQVEKLRAVGNKAIAGGQEGMNADRKTNTHRQAGMAASAYARAAGDEADGKTINSIADSIEIGAAGPLTNLTSRAQLTELKKALARGKNDSERGLTYSEQLERRGKPFGPEFLPHVSMPSRLVLSSWYRNAAMTLAKKAAAGNSKLIAALSKLGSRTEQWALVNDGDIAITRKAYKVLGTVKEEWYLKDPMEMLARFDRLNRMGVTNEAQLQDACRALLPHLAEKQEESAVVKAERAIIGQKVGIDFFPTPVAVAHRMARLARISKGMRVLEPSAGNGNLADAAAAAGGEVDVVEISSQLRDILTLKGYTAVAQDFNTFTPDEPYKAILMNPPFSKRQDAEHIMRAYGMLASGGTLVAIAGKGVFFGQDQKAEQFRAWLDSHNADIEKLEGGTFQDNALLAQTSANARLIVLHK